MRVCTCNLVYIEQSARCMALSGSIGVYIELLESRCYLSEWPLECGVLIGQSMSQGISSG